MAMTTHTSLSLLFLSLLLYHHTIIHSPKFANAGKLHNPDEQDDVDNDKEDEERNNWGQKKSNPFSQFGLNPSLAPFHIQDKMMNSEIGPYIGFVKLRLGIPRTQDALFQIAMKWSELLVTGGIEVRFTGIDLSTMLFAVKADQDINEVKEFLLEQPDAYEIKIGGKVYRRPGDRPLEEVIEMPHKEREKASHPDSDENLKDER